MWASPQQLFLKINRTHSVTSLTVLMHVTTDCSAVNLVRSSRKTAPSIGLLRMNNELPACLCDIHLHGLIVECKTENQFGMAYGKAIGIS